MAAPTPLSEVLQSHLSSVPNLHELARDADIPLATLHHWLKGRVRRPHTWQPLLRLAAALNLNAEETDRLLGAAKHPPLSQLISRAQNDSDRLLVARWTQPLTTPNLSIEQLTSYQEPPVAPYMVRSTTLPAPLTTLVGRETEIARIRELVLKKGKESVRLITLVGPGGIGKTRIALQVGADLLHAFPDGVYFIDLSPIRDPQLVASVFARSLNVPEVPGMTLLESLKGFCRNKRMLIIADNFEQVVSAAPLMSELLTSAPQLQILATSREVLHLYGEYKYRVPPLASPDYLNNSLPSNVLAGYPTVVLFIQRAQATNGNLALTDQTVQAIAKICSRLDGLPLAIELAAARSEWFSPHILLTRLDRRLNELTDGPQDLPHRQRSLRVTIDWSYGLLDPHEQVLFRQLGIFIGDFTTEAVAAICGSESDHDHTVFRDLRSFIDKSLLRHVVDMNGEPRFSMLETIREFAMEQLIASGEIEELHRRYAAYYLDLVEAGEPALTAAPQRSWLDRMEAEHDNLRRVLQQAIEKGDVDLATRLGAALWPFWHAHGHVREGLRWLEGVLACTSRHSPSTRAKVLIGAGRLTATKGNFKQAQEYFESGIALFRSEGDVVNTAMALNLAGRLAIRLTAFMEARQCLEESLELFRTADHKTGIATTLRAAGKLAHYMGERDRAVVLLEEGLQLGQEQGDKEIIASVLCELGDVVRWQRNYSDAAVFYGESMARFRELGHPEGIAASLHNLGSLALNLGDDERARELYEDSLQRFRTLGHTWSMADCLIGLAGLAGKGNPERAARLLGAAEAFRAITQDGIPTPANRADYEQIVASIRTQLDEMAWERLWAEGRAMQQELAIAYALASG